MSKPLGKSEQNIRAYTSENAIKVIFLFNQHVRFNKSLNHQILKTLLYLEIIKPY